MLENWLRKEEKRKRIFYKNKLGRLNIVHSPVIRRVRVRVHAVHCRVFYVEFELGSVAFIVVVVGNIFILYFGRHHPSQNLQTHRRHINVYCSPDNG